MQITQDEMVQFCNQLAEKCQQVFPHAYVELKLSPTGHYVVLIHSDQTLQCETECYTVDPISREWIKTYGTL